MKKALNKILNVDVRHYVLLCFLFASLFFSFTVYEGSLVRFVSALEDLCTSFLYWLFFGYGALAELLFGIDLPNVRATLLSFPQVSVEEIFNVDLAGLLAKLKNFPIAFGQLFGAYNVLLFNALFYLVVLGSGFIGAILLLLVAFYMMMFSKNDRPVGYVSKPARAYFSFNLQFIKPVKEFYSSLYSYAEEHNIFIYLLLAVWLLNFNVFTVFAELVAFYLYFICTFSLKALGFIFAYVGLDLLLLLLSMPLLYWLVAAGYCYYRVRYEQGVDELKHMEAKNCGYLKTLDLIVLIVGEPGTGKTTLLVDMFLSMINIYKDDSLKSLLKFELYFPSFPWARFRADLSDKIASRELPSQAHIIAYVDTFMDFYEVTGDTNFIYGYRTDIYKTTVDVGNREIPLRDALREYARAFAIYINENLGISNLPIRMDGNFDDSKYFKKWNGNFFEKKKLSRLSHILNQDMLRRGVKMDPNSKEIGAFGPSVIGWTEISKDLGNQNTNAQYKADSLTCNPKNEKINHSFMFIRHALTLIDNNPYIRIITDDQRAVNVAAASVALMCVVNITEKSETKIAINGFDWLFAFDDVVTKQFNKLSKKRENARGDITLSWLLIKQAVSCLTLPAERLRQQFGYEELTLLKQAGNAFSGNEGSQNTAGQASLHTYYKIYWKIYNDRFISDTHVPVFAEDQKRCGIGIDDIPTYKDLRMSVDEIEYHRSRLGNDLANKNSCNQTIVNSDDNFVFDDINFE